MKTWRFGVMLLSAALLLLTSCGGTPNLPSGIYGIGVTNAGERFDPTPSPLPGGFGESVLLPGGRAVVLVKVATGQQAGTVVARVETDSRGIFRVSLPPGKFVVLGKDEAFLGKTVTVRAGQFTRVIVRTSSRF